MKSIGAISRCCLLVLLVAPGNAQDKRLWVLRPAGEVTEYDPETFAAKQTIKAPAEAVAAPQNLLINQAGQMLFAPSVSLPLDESDVEGKQKIWFWDGHSVSAFTRDVARSSGSAGSNLAITESAPEPYLSADGSHLYWFSNQAHRLQRDGVDLSTKTTWVAWQSDLTGNGRQNLTSVELPDCSCPTGSCEESCAYGSVWVPEKGMGRFFLFTQFVAGKDQPAYKSSVLYQEGSEGKYNGIAIEPALKRVLDAPGPDNILEAVPDTGCCGWSNQSDDQTFLRIHGKTVTVFDERVEYKNADYDVSFYTDNGKLSPDLDNVGLTIVASTEANKPIQLAEQGQADPEESQRIRRALLDLPATEIKSINTKGSLEASRVLFLPHAIFIGWLSDDEILIIEDDVLVSYNIATKARRKSTIHVDAAPDVFLR